MAVALKEKIVEKLEDLPSDQLGEVLLFLEFLSVRESPEFIAYVNRTTEEALRAREKGEKFYALEELQKEFAGHASRT